MYDVTIRGGTIVDGTGAAPFVGDIAIDSDRIVAVGAIQGAAEREIGAEGLLVTPGWVGALPGRLIRGGREARSWTHDLRHAHAFA